VLTKELLDIIVCPKCNGQVQLSSDKLWLKCSPCHLKYPIREDIPVLLLDEAVRLK
jgi:uncharacterized protein